MILKAKTVGVFAVNGPLMPFARALDDYDDALKEDDSFEISLGDIAATCGSALALGSLPADIDRRSALSIIYPALKRSTRYTPDRRVRQCLAMLKGWLDGTADLDVDLARSLTEPDEGNPFWFAEPGRGLFLGRPGEERFDIDETVVRMLDGFGEVRNVFVKTIDYAVDEALNQEFFDEQIWEQNLMIDRARKRYHPSAIAQQIIDLMPDPEIEKIAQVRDILAISPLHSLELKDGALHPKW